MLDIHEVGRSSKRGAIWISNIIWQRQVFPSMGRLSPRLMGAPGGGDGVWLFTSLHNKLLKADTGQGRAGPRWLEGPSFFSLVGKSLCLWVSALLLSCAPVRFFFIFILLGLPGASYNLWLDSPLPPQFWNIFSHYLFPIPFPPLLLRP